MKKKYIVPEMEVIQFIVSQSMLILPVSNTGSATQWAPQLFLEGTEEEE